MMLTDTQLTALATDLDLCDVGLALTKGKLRRRYAMHRKACMDALKADTEARKAAGLIPDMTDDELLAELGL